MVEKRSYHKVANQILDLIDSGVFPPGTRLPGERDLAQKFGVSRVSIREAEISLHARGRLDIKLGSGAYVLDCSEQAITGLPKVDPFELTEARALFEAEAAALAASMITDETIQELEQYIEIMAGRLKSEMSPDDADAAFHNAIARSTNNHAIMFAVDSMWEMRKDASELQKVYRHVCDKDSTHREDEHQAILNALKNKDPVAARMAMRAHFTRMIEALLEASEKAAYQEMKRKTSESRLRFTITKQLK